MTVLVVTGTGTGVGKTVATAALAAAAVRAGRSVAVVKPAQTGVAAGEAGDVAEVVRLAGDAVRPVELARYPDPLAPATAARRARMRTVSPRHVAAAVRELAGQYETVLVEGAGGLLVRFDEEGSTLADVARLLSAPVLVVAGAALGTLNATALTAEALRARGLDCAGLVIGAWPAVPGLDHRCNREDLPVAADAPLTGILPEGAGGLAPETFRAAAAGWLAPSLGGTWDGSPVAPAAGAVGR